MPFLKQPSLNTCGIKWWDFRRADISKAIRGTCNKYKKTLVINQAISLVWLAFMVWSNTSHANTIIAGRIPDHSYQQNCTLAILYPPNKTRITPNVSNILGHPQPHKWRLKFRLMKWADAPSLSHEYHHATFVFMAKCWNGVYSLICHIVLYSMLIPLHVLIQSWCKWYH